MAKQIRQIPGSPTQDLGSVQILTYNEAAGGQKNMDIGHHLLPIADGSGGWTTNYTAAKSVGGGKTLAVYNNSTSIHALTLGEDATITALAAGVCDASGHVGVPCTPSAWTYIANYKKTHAIADHAALLCFVVSDETAIRVELANEPT